MRQGSILSGRTGQTRRQGADKRTATRMGAGRWAMVRTGGLRVSKTEALAKIPWLVHGFSTRPGGVSEINARPTLNLGFTEWDLAENVSTNRSKLMAALGADAMKLVPLRQFHSDVIVLINRAPPSVPRGDAAITSSPGVLLAVQTADCVPILLVDRKHRAVAVVHAGWRGTLRRITAKTVGRMHMVFGTRPSEVIAVIGPAIHRCCYEVGPEVAQSFASQFACAQDWFDGPTGAEPSPFQWLSMTPPGHDLPPPRVRLDLIAANRWQLMDAGLQPASISTSRLCTACRTDLLFSYRKEGGRTGRLMVVAGIRP